MSLIDCLLPQTPPPVPKEARFVEVGRKFGSDKAANRRLEIDYQRPKNKKAVARAEQREIVLNAITDEPQTSMEIAEKCGLSYVTVRAFIPGLRNLIQEAGWIRVPGIHWRLMTWRLK
jgi:hypothetical protein